ncbi:MAG: M20/M25/M40 family metallo-hydrolase [Planctomycetota bacterium]
MDIVRVIDRIDRDFETIHLDRLLRYIRQPSISAYNQGVREMAELLVEEIRSVGGEAELVETAEFPVVFGRIAGDADTTLLFHGLYDVTPADEPEWIVPPFEPQIRELPGLGRCVVGRGAEDTKTGIAVLINSLAACREVGAQLPLNLMFVFEASELGSGGLEEFVPRYAQDLQKADAVHWLWPMAHPDGTPIVPLSLKGNLMGRLVCRGGDWGGPIDNEMHALHANWVENPADRLIKAIAYVEQRLEEIYMQGAGWLPSDSQRRLVRALAARMDPDRIKTTLGIHRFRQERFADALEAHCFRPQFTVTGLRAGFVGAGKAVKVSIPAQAEAVVNMRFQPGEDPDEKVADARKILREGGYGDILFEVNNAYAGGGSPPEHPLVQGFLATHREMGLDPEVWPVHPVGMPVALWTEDLGLPWVGGLPCHAMGKHAANEYAQVKGIRRSEEFLARFFQRFARLEI